MREIKEVFLFIKVMDVHRRILYIITREKGENETNNKNQ